MKTNRPDVKFINDFIKSNAYSSYVERVNSFNYISMLDVQDLIAEYKEFYSLSDDELIEVIELLSPKIG